MEPVQLYLLDALAFCPIVILFGPILYRIARTEEFDRALHAISTLRDFETTKKGFLIWINLYMVSQLVYTLLALPFIVEIPNFLYILVFGSLIFGVVAFVFVSTTKKHYILVALSSLCTIFSLFGLGLVLYKIDFFLALISTIVAMIMLFFLTAVPLNKMRMWLAEYLALTALCVWNLIILLKVS